MDWHNSKWDREAVALRGRGTFKALHVVNKGAADAYVMFFDAIDVPRSGSIPLRAWALPGTGSATIEQTLDHEVLAGGRDVDQGIVIVVSSTIESFTAVADRDFLIEVGFDVKGKNSATL